MPTYTLRGVEVQFPHEAYTCQLEYMEKVIEALQNGLNALLESPTGTGKTLCLLCATLAWRESLKKEAQNNVDKIKDTQHTSELVQGLKEAYAEYKLEKMEKEGEGLPTIIYASRTHSQLQQVMKELQATAYTPRAAVLSSRQQSCLHPTVSQLPGSAGNASCRKLVAQRGCKWHYGVERYTKGNPDGNLEVLDIEDLAKLGRERQLCPYFLSRKYSETADIIFMPYNYLVDAKTRSGLKLTWPNAVLIFDEAHNVEGTCSDAMSFDLPAHVIAGAIEEVGTAAELAVRKAEGAPSNVADEGGMFREASEQYYQLATEMRQLQLVLKKFEQEVAAIKINKDQGFTAPGIFLFELFAKFNLTADTWSAMSHIMDESLALLTDNAAETGRKFQARSSSYRLYGLQDALSLAFLTLIPLNAGDPPNHLGYRVHLHLNKVRDGQLLPTLSYWCFSPGQSMASIAQMQVRSILLTSGTLSPLNSFAHELSIPFPVQLENPHVIDQSQVWVGVVPVGPSGHALNASYKTREDKRYKEDLGNAIVNFARIVPDGLLVFFPAYGVMKSCIDAWKGFGGGSGSIWERIKSHKEPIIEPREASLFPQAAADFRAKLDSPTTRGAAFFAVCRGKVSEGLDFSDRAGRAVIITGIPYAMMNDPKVKIKQEVLNENLRSNHKRPHNAPAPPQGISGDEWYKQQAIRAVNQAMGRVIRHKRDYGAIILCDERFKAKNIQTQMSLWLRDSTVVHPNYGAATASLTKFFRQHAEMGNEAPMWGGSSMGSIAGGPGQGKPKGVFEVAPSRASTGQQQHQNQAPQQRLTRRLPAAIDLAGVTHLMGGIAAGTAPWEPQQQQQRQQQEQQQRNGSGRLLDLLGQSNPASKQQGGFTLDRGPPQPPSSLGGITGFLAGTGTKGAQRPTSAPASPSRPSSDFLRDSDGKLKPWERRAYVPLLRPNGPRPADPLGSNQGGGAGAQLGQRNDLPTIVGPSHKIEKHQEQMKQKKEQDEQQQAGEVEDSTRGARPGPQAPSAAGGGREGRTLENGKNPIPNKKVNVDAGPPQTGGQFKPGSNGRTHPAAKGQGFLAELKSELGEADFRVVAAALKEYAQVQGDEAKQEAAVERVLGLIRKSGKAHLLAKFREYLPRGKSQRPPGDIQLPNKAPARSQQVSKTAAGGTTGLPT